MGAWGPGLFSDDLTADVRAEYRARVEDGASDADAERAVVERYGGTDEEDLVWVALAVCESRVGRLSEPARAKALDALDSGRLLQAWIDLDGDRVPQRRVVLERARQQLVGEQPARRRLRPPWRHVTDLVVGDLLTLTGGDGTLSVVWVVRVEDNRLGVAPWLAQVDWHGTALPDDVTLFGHPPVFGVWGTPRLISVGRYRTRDPDWRDVGFVRHRTVPLGDDGPAQPVAEVYTGWDGVAGLLR